MRMTFVSVTSGGSGSLGEAYIYTPFMKKVLYITERKRKSNVHHYGKSDDFGAGFEVAEWRVFCHSAWLQISPARFKQVYSDSAGQIHMGQPLFIFEVCAVTRTPGLQIHQYSPKG